MLSSRTSVQRQVLRPTPILLTPSLRAKGTMTGGNDNFKEGDKASWNWGSKEIGPGEVTKVSDKKTTIESKGKEITKDGSKDNPAVVVEGGSRNPVVKRASELNKQDDE